MTAEESFTAARSSSLEAPTLLDLATKFQSMLTGIVSPPQIGRKTKVKLLNLIMLNVSQFGPGPRVLYIPCSPLDILSQPNRKVFGRSPTFIRPSLTRWIIVLNHSVSSIRGDASQLSRTFLEKRPWYVQLNSFSSPYTSMIDGSLSIGHGHQSSFASFIWLWHCDYLWRFPQTFFTLWPLIPSKSSLELFKSSYASTARAFIDHQLVRESSKLVFNHVYLLVSTDSPSLASFLKPITTLENS
ncbi:unnamed protein product [Arabidopsis thaliana]|uniref:Uncharacterized protein n=1 Tax=Arabidopsis thaliana TaxID=3702 RepID=A0A5S9WWY0_ARATH|nr:unnamed protein product [Arabidopsis thaliana]